MSKKLIFIATMALVLTGCGDNDVATMGEPSMLDEAMDSTGDVANAVSDTDSSVTDASKTEEMTTEEVMDSTSDAANAVSDTDSSVTDAIKPEDMTTEEAQEYMDKEMEILRGE